MRFKHFQGINFTLNSSPYSVTATILLGFVTCNLKIKVSIASIFYLQDPIHDLVHPFIQMGHPLSEIYFILQTICKYMKTSCPYFLHLPWYAFKISFICCSAYYNHKFFVLARTNISYNNYYISMNTKSINLPLIILLKRTNSSTESKSFALIPLDAGTTCHETYFSLW